MLDNKEFEEKAWGSMLELLDKEMPEKQAFPWFRSLILLLLLLFIGGGIGYSYVGSNDVKEYGSETTSAIAKSIDNQENKTDKNVSIDTKNQKGSIIEEESSSRSVNLASSESEPSTDKQSKIVQTSSSFSSTSSSYNSSSQSISHKQITDKTLVENDPINFTTQQDVSKVYASTFQSTDENRDEQIVVESTPTAFSENLRLSESTLESKSLLSLSNPLNFSSIQQIADENKLLLKTPGASRITSLYAVTDVAYNTDFRSLATSAGLIGEIGASNSPLSFSTGLVYERYSLQSFEKKVYADLAEDELIETGGSSVVDKNEALDASALLSISYLSVPLQFHYRFNYIKLGLGIENKFLVNQQVRDGFTRAEVSNQFAGLEDTNDFGPNKYHLTANQSIAVRIRPRIDIGLHFQYDLTGIFAESAFTLSNANTSNRLDNVGISLAYKLK